jgi:hypothetical protein
MAVQILQVNFKLNVPGSDYEQAASQLAPMYAEVPGLRWKVWILNEAEAEAGGIYLFEDEEALQNYLGSGLAAEVQNHPALRDFSVKTFSVMPQQTEITRGPI